MNKSLKIMCLKNRIAKLSNNQKENSNIIRKLGRKLRNMEKQG